MSERVGVCVGSGGGTRRVVSRRASSCGDFVYVFYVFVMDGCIVCVNT